MTKWPFLAISDTTFLKIDMEHWYIPIQSPIKGNQRAA